MSSPASPPRSAPADRPLGAVRGRPAPAAPDRPPASPDGGADLVGLLGVLAALLLPLAFSPAVYHLFWAPKAALCLVLVGPGLVTLARLVRGGSAAASLAALFLGSATVSAALSGHVAAALTGAPNSGTGLLFVAATTGAWAIGVAAGAARRRQMVTALLAAALVNALVAWLQARGLVPVPLESPGRSFGLMGNPVYLGALAAGAVWVVAARAGRRGRLLPWLAAVVVLAGAAQLSGGRAAVGLAVVSALAGFRLAGPRRGAALLAALAVGFLAAGAWAGGGAVTGSSRAVGSESTAQLGTRVGFWRIGALAALDRPVFGWGPGRFEAATSPRATAAVSEGGVNVYKDAHNWLVEYAVTAGAVGLGLLLAWLVVSGRAATGPLAGFAVSAGLFMLVEPVSVGIAPLALLALGASGPPAPRPVPADRLWRAATGVALVVGLLVAGVFVTGEALLERGRLDSSTAGVARASALLPPWAEVSRLAARTEVFAGLRSETHRAEALALAREATRREPEDAASWSYLAQLELVWGTDEAAARAIHRTLERHPWYADGLRSAAVLAARTGDREGLAAACGRLRTIGLVPDRCGGPATVES